MLRIAWILAPLLLAGTAGAAPIYLNDANITVALGASMAAEPFSNRSASDSLASIIDAPNAAASELHLQSTHVWVSGGPLELDFDFGMEYDLTTFHFWNYHSEGFDVDDIDLMFFDASMTLVGTVEDVMPALGNTTGSDSTPIFAEDLALNFPAKVRFVNAVLSGSNGQVDYNNMGFTGSVTVPEPGSLALVLLGVTLLAASRTR